MQNILVCGGAGYIGSHVVKKLQEAGFNPIVFDNLTTGHRESLSDNIQFYQGDVRSEADLSKVFTENNISAVMHFCAKSLVGESMEKPALYFDNNVVGGLNLLKVMHDFGIDKLVFSSTAAVYGQPDEIPINETTTKLPTNVYGETKLMFEKVCSWYDSIYGLRYVALRYFNAAGADDDGLIGEDHNSESHLLPIVFQVVNGQREFLSVFGDDYNTPDGTCVRDYIHVYDLASAHILALKHLLNGGSSDVFNLGSGLGYSVKEIVDSVEKITGRGIDQRIVKRREGDPDTLIASSQKIIKELGWKQQYTLEMIIETAYKWHKNHPNGYEN